ncbi:Large tegument protein deneddylase [Bienertia sinuspersici]
MSTTAIFSLLLLICHLTTTISTSLIPGLDSFLTHQSQVDPTASNDTFLSLPSHLKHSLSSDHSPSSVDHRISSLLSLSLPISLHVILVGPSFSSSSPSTLSSFLSHSLSSSSFHLTTTPTSTHRLSLLHSLHHHTSLSPPSLSHSLSSALQSSLSSTPSSIRSPLVSLPFSTLDSLISSHHQSNHQNDAYTLYLINLGPQSKPYAYSYSSSSESSSPSFTRCLGSIWQSNNRYIWIDLSAGPVDYGPGLSGDGLLPRGDFHPLAAFHSTKNPKSHKALLADLASLVYSAYHSLLVPPLRIPVPFENSLVVQFIHVVDDGDDSSSNNGYGLDWGLIQSSLLADEGLLFRDQTLSFKRYKIKFRDCGLCSFAISKSISSYTSRFLFDNYTMIVSEYVDSKKLHQILSDSADEFKRLAGVHEEDDFKRVIPVYVFDLDLTNLLMLDRFHQSVAFKDMVVAIRTKNTQTVSDYTCNGRHVFTQTRELERPIIGSILQSMWGVSPTHLQWSSNHNTTLVDYTWSVGQTPFGPFSEMSSLSFVQKDAARRNVLLTSLNYTVSSAIEVLESARSHSSNGGKLLKGKQITEFSQRWFLFKYKLDKMISALSHLEFDLASYYLRSSEHDLYAMHSIVYHASQELEASLVCFTDPPLPWASVSMSAAVFFLLCFVYAKRDKFFTNKSKQF